MVQVEPTLGRRALCGHGERRGLVHTDDAGRQLARHWVGFRLGRPPMPGDTLASPNATGCLAVNWGVTAGGADDPPNDEVWVGTGEGLPSSDGMPGDRLAWASAC